MEIILDDIKNKHFDEFGLLHVMTSIIGPFPFHVPVPVTK
jgi:hypothetical protein